MELADPLSSIYFSFQLIANSMLDVASIGANRFVFRRIQKTRGKVSGIYAVAPVVISYVAIGIAVWVGGVFDAMVLNGVPLSNLAVEARLGSLLILRPVFLMTEHLVSLVVFYAPAFSSAVFAMLVFGAWLIYSTQSVTQNRLMHFVEVLDAVPHRILRTWAATIATTIAALGALKDITSGR